jgi:hypothetical protein
MVLDAAATVNASPLPRKRPASAMGGDAAARSLDSFPSESAVLPSSATLSGVRDMEEDVTEDAAGDAALLLSVSQRSGRYVLGERSLNIMEGASDIIVFVLFGFFFGGEGVVFCFTTFKGASDKVMSAAR